MALNIAHFKDRERPEPDWIIPNMLKRGNTAFIIGQPKRATKSWLILDACWSLSEGKPLWGIKRSMVGSAYQFVGSRPMRCVYFTQEDTEDDVHDRIIAHLGLHRQITDRLWIVPKNLRIVFDTIAGQQLMQNELDSVVSASGPIDLVCFDPMRRMHQGNENDSQVIAKIWEVLDRIHTRYKCATMIAHHIKKPPLDKSGYDPTDPFVARGSGDIFGGGDSFMTIVAKDRTAEWQKVAMYFESKRGAPMNPVMLKVNFPDRDTGLFKLGVLRAVEWLGFAFEESEGEERAKKRES